MGRPSKYTKSDAELDSLVLSLRSKSLSSPERLAKELEIWRRILPLTKTIMARLGVKDINWDEIEAEVMVGVFEAAAIYDPKRGNFAGLVSTITRNKIVNLIRSMSVAAKSMPSLRFDMEVTEDGDTTLADIIPDPRVEKLERHGEDAEELANMLTELDGQIGLSGLERELLYLHAVTDGRQKRMVENYNTAHPKRHHIKLKAVDNCLQRIRRKVQRIKKEPDDITS